MSVVADTHALHWFLLADERLSDHAREVLASAQLDPDAGVKVSVASRFDLAYLARSGKLTTEEAHEVWAATTDETINIEAVAITASVAEHFDREELATLRDPWDRIIVATAIDLGLPLVTKDRAITALSEAGVVEVLW